jgi:hypothetical protein
MKQPYLIQRGKINHPIAPVSACISEAIDFDYMGSSEFEFGALSKSLRRIEKSGWKIRSVPEIMQGEIALRVWSPFSDEEFEEYKAYLIQLRIPGANSIRTKERTAFEEGSTISECFGINFWWDIQNDVMFGFNKVFMKRVSDYVGNSLKLMNKKED